MLKTNENITATSIPKNKKLINVIVKSLIWIFILLFINTQYFLTSKNHKASLFFGNTSKLKFLSIKYEVIAVIITKDISTM